MPATDKAQLFHSLHRKGNPIELFNAWDVASAVAIAEAGAPAIATGSWAVAAAQGYADGEAIPLDFVVALASRMVAALQVPLTVDFEGGYAEDPAKLAAHVGRLMELGVVGINFEDRVVAGSGLYPIDRQQERIAAIRAEAERRGQGFFLNARTDLFLGSKDDPATHLAAAKERAAAYASAGASGFFVPALRDERLIAEICAASPLPVNVMVVDGLAPKARLAELGVARISHGPRPFRQAMATLRATAEPLYRKA